MILRILLFLAVFALTLIWRFPYEQAIADRIARLESRTGMQLDYTPVAASAAGVEWKDVRLTSPSGLRIQFNQAKLRPSLDGMSAYFSQGKGQARLLLARNGELSLRSDQLQVDSGSAQFGQVQVTGNISHNLNRRSGEGSVRLELPNHKIPIPVEVPSFESGSRLFWQDRGQGYELRAEVKLTGGAEMSADGNLLLEPQPGQPGKLSGTINFQTKLAKGRISLLGSWKSPQWMVTYDR